MRGPIVVARFDDLQDRIPIAVLVEEVDLVVTRIDGDVSVLHWRCVHHGALLADGEVRGDDLMCGVHGWDFNVRSGVSAYENSEQLARFTSVVVEGVVVDAAEIREWAIEHPQPYDRGPSARWKRRRQERQQRDRFGACVG